MRKLITFIALMLAFVSYAQDSSSNGDKSTETQLKGTISNKPRTPFVSEITCYYDYESMSFASDGELGFLDVEITDALTGETWNYCISGDDAISITLTGAAYIITCTTEQSIEYSGILMLQ